jgi:hypothetical protein
MDYSAEKGVFEVVIKMYYDDFLRDYKLCYGGDENFGFSDNDSASLIVIEKYLSEKVKVLVNEKRLEGKSMNMSLDDNEIIINMEYGKVMKPRVVTVNNNIMTSLYSDQANMLIIRVNDFEEGVRLTPLSPERTFRIK